eukprot:COSAG02_NODE_43728_length_372_cov_0.761905_1_plen_27_part_10
MQRAAHIARHVVGSAGGSELLRPVDWP